MNPPLPHKTLADIGDFLATLRTGGVPIGPGELERLRWLFGREPPLDRDGLKTLLSALLVKTPEQRKTFEALFADWCPNREADWPEEIERAAPNATRRPLHSPLPTPPEPPDLPAEPVDSVWFWQAEIDLNAVTAPLEWPWLVLLGLVALAIALAARGKNVLIAGGPGWKRDERTGIEWVNVTWEQARSFCQDAGGDLPTEAQWEYAARGGSRSSWSFGNDEAQLGNYAWFSGNSYGKAHNVAEKLPNPLGLYDMHGNVWEWVRDWYDGYMAGIFVDPLGLDSTGRRILRGGSFGDPPPRLRSVVGFIVSPEFKRDHDGFRCIRDPPPQP